MNNEEAAIVLAKAQAYRPSIVVDDITVAAWQEAFDDIRFEDASRAVTNLGRASSQYLDPARIREEVTRLLAENNSGAQTHNRAMAAAASFQACPGETSALRRLQMLFVMLRYPRIQRLF